MVFNAKPYYPKDLTDEVEGSLAYYLMGIGA